MTQDHLAEKVISMASGSTPPFFVAICGWADTGKSTLADSICSAVRQRGVTADWISTDAFLNDRESRNSLGLTGYNPASIDANAMMAAIKQLADGSAYSYFPYENRIGKKSNQSKKIASQSIMIIEGIHALHSSLLAYLNFKLFINADVDVLRTH